MLRNSGGDISVLPGDWTVATLPAGKEDHFAWVTDKPGGAGLMFCDGVSWVSMGKRTESFIGTTDGSGLFSVVFSPAYPVTPDIQPVTIPPADSVTRVRLTAASATGFTVRTETNSSVTILSISVLGFATTAVPSVPVRVFVSAA